MSLHVAQAKNYSLWQFGQFQEELQMIPYFENVERNAGKPKEVDSQQMVAFLQTLPMEVFLHLETKGWAVERTDL